MRCYVFSINKLDNIQLMNYIYVHHDGEPNLNYKEETSHGISTLDPLSRYDVGS
jgi:hypothetical protein